MPIFSSLAPLYDGSVTTAKILNGAVTEAKITLADNTTNNVSIIKHGLVPKASNNADEYLNGLGAWASASGVLTLLKSNSGNTTQTSLTTQDTYSLSASELSSSDILLVIVQAYNASNNAGTQILINDGTNTYTGTENLSFSDRNMILKQHITQNCNTNTLMHNNIFMTGEGSGPLFERVEKATLIANFLSAALTITLKCRVATNGTNCWRWNIYKFKGA